MPAVVATEELSTWTPPAAKPLDEAVWTAWVARGRARDRRSAAVRISAVKWASIAVLVGAAGLWLRLVPFEIEVKFLVTAGAMIVLVQALQTRHYAVAAVFGVVALFYNPVVPVFSFSHDWQHAVVAASTIPFVLSLANANTRTKPNA